MPKTILMTADTVGGVWTYALELTAALQKYGITVYLATMGEKLSESQWRASEKLSNLVIKESDFALEWMDDPWDEVDRAGRWLLELEQQIEPDLIHLNNYVHGSLPWNVPVLIVGHSCVLSWWEAVKGEPPPGRLNSYAEKVKAGLRQADCVIGVTKYMSDCLSRHYGPFPFSGHIYNARDKSRFRSAAKKPLIFSMGRLWDEGKNISLLTAVADRLSWPVYIAGEDHGRLAEGTENVNFLGKIESAEVVEWLSAAGIYVLPARYEPFGLSVLEAALSGCALVLGDIPSLREVWNDAAMFAGPGDRGGVRHQIESLIGNAAKRQAMARKAGERARYYSPERFAEQYTNLYRQLLLDEKEKIVAE